jgi:hypothetical protein
MRALVAVLFIVTACGGYRPPDAPEPRDATRVDASVTRAWDAVVEQFATRNIPIRTVERASGLIVTDQLAVGREGRSWADCGKAHGRAYRPNAASYNVLVRGDSSAATVKATVRWTLADLKGNSVQCVTTHTWEREFEALVKEQAEAAPSATTAAPVARAPTAAGAEEYVDSSNARPNEILLTFPQFSRAVGDVIRKDIILSYREAALERLEVELSAKAFTEPTLEYHLTRLFLAYSGTLASPTAPAVILRANGQPVGRYSRAGLRWDEEVTPR